MKTQEKLEARRLRIEEQLSIKDIAVRLGVAKSTVSLWVRDLPLSDRTIKEKCLTGRIKGGKSRRFYARKIRAKYQLEGCRMAEEYYKDPLFFGGCMMHWAEGSKHKNRVGISNTDPHFLRLWLKFIRHFFAVQATSIAIAVHCYLDNGKTKSQIEKYWLSQLGLPRSCLRKTTVVTKHKFSTFAKKNRHPYGVAHITIGSTEVIQKIWGAIKFLGEIDDTDRWLD